MRILVTGANGQLGQEFKNNISNSDHEFYFTDENELDITKKKEIIDAYIESSLYEFIFNDIYKIRKKKNNKLEFIVYTRTVII